MSRQRSPIFKHLSPYNVQPLRADKDYVIPICPSDNFNSNCFDIVNQEDYDIYDYLNATDIDNKKERTKEMKKRMILFYGDDLDHVHPYCYHTDYIEQINPLTNIYTTDCKKNPSTGNYYATSAGSVLRTPLLRIDLKFPVYIYLHHFMAVTRDPENRIFLIIPSETEYERTASLGSLDYINGVPNPDMGRYVSADHCQAGTNKKVCSIYVCPRDVVDEYLKEDRMPLNVRYSKLKNVKNIKKSKKQPRSNMRRDSPVFSEVSKPVSRKPRVSARRSRKSRVSSRKSRMSGSRSRKSRMSGSRSRKSRVSGSRSRKSRVSGSRSRKSCVSGSRSRKSRVSGSRSRKSTVRKPRSKV